MGSWACTYYEGDNGIWHPPDLFLFIFKRNICTWYFSFSLFIFFQNLITVQFSESIKSSKPQSSLKNFSIILVNGHSILTHILYIVDVLLYLKGSGFVRPDPKRVDKAVSCCVRVHAYELIPVNSLKRKVCSKICFCLFICCCFLLPLVFFTCSFFAYSFFWPSYSLFFICLFVQVLIFWSPSFFSLACQVIPHLLICLPPASKSFQGVTHTLYWSGHLVVKPGQMKYQAYHEL